MYRILIALIGAGAVGGSAVCELCRTPADSRAAVVVSMPALVTTDTSRTAPRTPAAEPRTVTFHVEGMTCGGCAIATRKVLERLAGVRKADVSYERRKAVVSYDSSRVTVDQMIDAVKTLHYTATVVTK
jgi:copper chaperone CopZ